MAKDSPSAKATEASTVRVENLNENFCDVQCIITMWLTVCIHDPVTVFVC